MQPSLYNLRLRSLNITGYVVIFAYITRKKCMINPNKGSSLIISAKTKMLYSRTFVI